MTDEDIKLGKILNENRKYNNKAFIDARNQLVENHLDFVDRMLNRPSVKKRIEIIENKNFIKVEEEDVKQELYLNMLHSAEKWQYELGEFEDYCFFTINLDELLCNDRLIKVPRNSNYRDKYVKLTSTENIDDFSNDDDDEFDEEVANNKKELSYTEEGFNKVEYSSMNDSLREILKTYLSKRELEILLLRLGLKDGEIHTLESLSEEYGVNKERIRQIEKKALQKLRCNTKIYKYFKDRDFLK